jgi:hypothetical protein
MFSLAETHNYDMLIKTDADTYMKAIPLSEMLLKIGNIPMVYVGALKVTAWKPTGYIFGFQKLNKHFLEDLFKVIKNAKKLNLKYHIMMVGQSVNRMLIDQVNALVTLAKPLYWWCATADHCGRNESSHIPGSIQSYFQSLSGNMKYSELEIRYYRDALYVDIHTLPTELASPVAMMKHLGYSSIAYMGYEPTKKDRSIDGIMLYELKHRGALCEIAPCLKV